MFCWTIQIWRPTRGHGDDDYVAINTKATPSYVALKIYIVSSSSAGDMADACADCFYPICRNCFLTSKSSKEEKVAIPQALTNDNFWGFATEVIYKHRVRWIESAAACPVFTCLITYYVEGDRGHMMNVEHHRPNWQYAVRGNVYSFHLPWEEIAKKLGSVLEDDGLDVLPHTEETLASLVLFSLRIGDVVDLNKWMPQARIRPHVVLKLLEALVDARYPFQ